MKTVLVTGGGGFLGKAIIKQLLEEGNVSIKVFLGTYPELTDLGCTTVQMVYATQIWMNGCRIKTLISSFTSQRKRSMGFKGIFLVDQCHRHKIYSKHHNVLVWNGYTSSPSAVWNGGDEINLTEHQCPTLRRDYLTYYPLTKATAEKEV